MMSRGSLGHWLLGCSLLVLATFAVADERLRSRFESLQAGYQVEAAGDRLLATNALSRFYEQRDFQLAWIDGGDREMLLQGLALVANDGLNPADYHQAALQQLLARDFQSLAPSDRTDLDLLLSDAFLLLGSHLLEGKVNPQTIDPEWFANRRQRDMPPLLAQALESHTVLEALEELRPRQAGYQKLKIARGRLLQHLNDDWQPIPDGQAVKPGMRDSRMMQVRERLAILGDFPAGPGSSYSEDENADLYSTELEGAVRRFQARHGLEDDGIIGRDTLAALNITPAMRLQQITLNLERWRWLPDSLGETHVMVNIASFELQLIEQGNVRLRKRVIVGKPYRRTPVFSDSIKYLVFNPTWTVPRKLMIEDKLPEISRDPDYLERLGFAVYKGWGTDRQLMDPAVIDWRSLSARNFPYQLVQAPGLQNALGQVKFMFPNEFNVYLHDTPSRDLFQKSERSFSSGCIRVQDPLELAKVLLTGNSRWPAEKVDEVISSQQTETVYLKKPVPVHLGYWTAWRTTKASHSIARTFTSGTSDCWRLLPPR